MNRQKIIEAKDLVRNALAAIVNGEDCCESIEGQLGQAIYILSQETRDDYGDAMALCGTGALLINPPFGDAARKPTARSRGEVDCVKLPKLYTSSRRVTFLENGKTHIVGVKVSTKEECEVIEVMFDGEEAAYAVIHSGGHQTACKIAKEIASKLISRAGKKIRMHANRKAREAAEAEGKGVFYTPQAVMDTVAAKIEDFVGNQLTPGERAAMGDHE